MGASRVKVVVEVEVPGGDDEGVYREEFRRELAKKDTVMENSTREEGEGREVASFYRLRGSSEALRALGAYLLIFVI